MPNGRTAPTPQGYVNPQNNPIGMPTDFLNKVVAPGTQGLEIQFATKLQAAQTNILEKTGGAVDIFNNNNYSGQGTGGSHAEGSQHYDGNALDVSTRNLTPDQQLIVAKAMGEQNLTIGNGDGHIHVENTQDANGKGTYFDEGGHNDPGIKDAHAEGTGNPAAPAAGAGGAAAKAAGAGGGGCIGGGAGPAGAAAGAAAAAGQGLSAANIISKATGLLTNPIGTLMSVIGPSSGGLLGAIPGISNITQGISDALGGLGANIAPSLTGVFSGALSGLDSALGSLLRQPLTLFKALQSKGGLQGLLPMIASNMIGGSVSGFITNLSFVQGMSAQARDMVGIAAEGAGMLFGAAATGGLGALFGNNGAIATFGTSALGDLTQVSAALVNMGTWDTTDKTRFQQPGHVAKQILDKGLGVATGLTDALIKANIPLLGVDDPQYDAQVLVILTNINDPTAVGLVSSAFQMVTVISNLGQLCDLSYMMQGGAATMPVRDFGSMGNLMAQIGITEPINTQDLGTALSKVETIYDLNNAMQATRPFDPNLAEYLMKVFGYGGGTYGEITAADFLGTAAGYVHENTLPVLQAGLQFVSDHPEAQRFIALQQQLADLLQGKFTVLDPQDAKGGDSSSSNSANTVPTGTITIPGAVDNHGVTFTSGGVFTMLDDAVLYLIPLIEGEMSKLVNTKDPVLKATLDKMDMAYNCSLHQILKENHYLGLYNVNLFDQLPTSPIDIATLSVVIPAMGLQTGYGSTSQFLEKMATNDIHGDMIKMAMRMERNKQVLGPLGINIDRFNMPQSEYYRDPTTFYERLYTNNLPNVPRLLADPYLPQSPGEVYYSRRDQLLTQAGYGAIPLLPAQKDELAMDLQFRDLDPSVLARMGESIVKTAVDRNMGVNGDEVYTIGLDGSYNPIAKITQTGLIMTGNDVMIAKMLQIVNKLLYGNIGVTKNTNPLNTDQIVFGVMEMLSQVTPGNIDALKNTLLGVMVCDSLLTKIQNRFGGNKSLFDTTMDRNDPIVWGGTGPDTGLDFSMPPQI
jgi:hypothetical protein